ncbi:MAG: hypothetical protein K0R47_2693 [Brevibacillus sp.]|nr:hypothetical protein [Brevibacillus sp.]
MISVAMPFTEITMEHRSGLQDKVFERIVGAAIFERLDGLGFVVLASFLCPTSPEPRVANEPHCHNTE